MWSLLVRAFGRHRGSRQDPLLQPSTLRHLRYPRARPTVQSSVRGALHFASFLTSIHGCAIGQSKSHLLRFTMHLLSLIKCEYLITPKVSTVVADPGSQPQPHRDTAVVCRGWVPGGGGGLNRYPRHSSLHPSTNDPHVHRSTERRARPPTPMPSPSRASRIVRNHSQVIVHGAGMVVDGFFTHTIISTRRYAPIWPKSSPG